LGRILDRYILREVFTSWLGVTAVLLVIMLTNQIGRVLERAAEQQYPRDVVLELIGLGALQNLSIIMPIGMLLGVVLALGRMYHDSEIAALQACGAGPARLYRPVVALAVVVTGFLIWLSFELAPAAAGRVITLRNEALRAGQFAPIAPGKFRTFGGGSTVVYAQSADPDGTLRRVFVQRQRAGRVEVALADRATHSVANEGLLHIITMYDGERFEGVPGQKQFRIVRFAENVVPVRVPQAALSAAGLEGLTTRELADSADPAKRAEFHWRIAAPLMAIVLALIAVPLARLRPRQGRYARIGFAILLFFVYTNLASAGRVWIARGTMPEWLGLWWVHAAVGVIAASIVLVPQWLARLRHRDVASS
jgi:lipopolysaccharide export system permease protein